MHIPHSLRVHPMNYACSLRLAQTHDGLCTDLTGYACALMGYHGPHEPHIHLMVYTHTP